MNQRSQRNHTFAVLRQLFQSDWPPIVLRVLCFRTRRDCPHLSQSHQPAQVAVPLRVLRQQNDRFAFFVICHSELPALLRLGTSASPRSTCAENLLFLLALNPTSRQ